MGTENGRRRQVLRPNIQITVLSIERNVLQHLWGKWIVPCSANRLIECQVLPVCQIVGQSVDQDNVVIGPGHFIGADGRNQPSVWKVFWLYVLFITEDLRIRQKP